MTRTGALFTLRKDYLDVMTLLFDEDALLSGSSVGRPSPRGQLAMTAPNVLLTSPDPALSAAGDDGSSLPPEDSPLSFWAPEYSFFSLCVAAQEAGACQFPLPFYAGFQPLGIFYV